MPLQRLLKKKQSNTELLALCVSSPNAWLGLQLSGSEGNKLRLSQFAASKDGSLRSFAEQRKQFSGRPLTTLLKQGEYQLVIIDAPEIPQEEWKAALEFRLKEFTDIPQENCSFDIIKIPSDKHAPGRRQQCLLTIANNQQIDGLMKSFSAAQLKLDAIDIPEMAQRNVASLYEEPGRALAMLGFMPTGALITVNFDGDLYLSRFIETPIEALEGGANENRAKLYERIALEAQRTLDNFDRQYSFTTINRFLVMPIPHAEALIQELSNNISIPVEKLDLGQKIDLGEKLSSDHKNKQHELLYPLGCALRAVSSATHINLVNEALIPKKNLLNTTNALLFCLALLVICFAVRLYYTSRLNEVNNELSQLNNRTKELQAELQSSIVKISSSNKVQQLKDQLNSKYQELNQLRNANQAYTAQTVASRGFSTELHALANIPLPDVWLTALQIRRESRQVHITARTQKAGSMHNYLEKLAASSVFAEQNFDNLNVQAVTQKITPNKASVVLAPGQKPPSDPEVLEFVLDNLQTETQEVKKPQP